MIVIVARFEFEIAGCGGLQDITLRLDVYNKASVSRQKPSRAGDFAARLIRNAGLNSVAVIDSVFGDGCRYLDDKLSVLIQTALRLRDLFAGCVVELIAFLGGGVFIGVVPKRVPIT